MEEKAKMTVKEFCGIFDCSRVYVMNKMKSLAEASEEMKNHVNNDGKQYILDKYAVEMLMPQKEYKQYTVSFPDEYYIRKMQKEINKLTEKERRYEKMITEKQGLNIKEFAEKYECSYEATSRKLKKLLKTDAEMKNHVRNDGKQYILDEYAISALVPKRYVRRKEDPKKIERLKKEHDYLIEKQRSISNAIKQREQELYSKRLEQMGRVIFRCLDRMYIDGDENRLEDFLSNSEDFKSYMNKTNENLREDIL